MSLPEPDSRSLSRTSHFLMFLYNSHPNENKVLSHGLIFFSSVDSGVERILCAN